MTGIKRRIERLEEKSRAGREEGPNQIVVRFVDIDGATTDTMIIDIDQRRPQDEKN